MAKNPRVKVIQPADEPEIERGILATAIMKISDAAEALHRSGLNEDAVVILLSAKSLQSKSTCRDMLRHLRELRSAYCR